MNLRTYIVKLSGCRYDGRSVDGEYDGGRTIDAARAEAATFRGYCPTGTITIYQPTRDGGLSYVEEVR